MKKLFSALSILVFCLTCSFSLSAQSKYDKEQGNISMPSYEKEKSSSTYSPSSLQGQHYSYWVTYKEDGIPKANIYAKTDGSYYAVDFGLWYRYDTFDNAAKAWYIYKKWGVIMKKGTDQR